MFRAGSVEGELNFYDIMLAWSRIIKDKYNLPKGCLLGCGLNEFALVDEYLFSGASCDDLFIKGVDVWLDYNKLPFANDEFGLVVSTQLMEASLDISAISEIARVLSGEGFLLLFFFRKCSSCAVQRCYSNFADKYPKLYNTFALKQYLIDLDMEILMSEPVSFRPFVPEHNFAKFLYLEFIGATLFPFFSTCSLILARKKVLGSNLSFGEFAV